MVWQTGDYNLQLLTNTAGISPKQQFFVCDSLEMLRKSADVSIPLEEHVAIKHTGMVPA